ncbi:MAG: hypothetical protein HY815_00205 [Candidatus Riflebacteria bacterium]|nr:hypothetical protein [Candidatus Riflebacteria bacterium]
MARGELREARSLLNEMLGLFESARFDLALNALVCRRALVDCLERLGDPSLGSSRTRASPARARSWI